MASTGRGLEGRIGWSGLPSMSLTVAAVTAIKRLEGSVAKSSFNLITLSSSVGRTSSSTGPSADLVVAPVRVVALAPIELLCRVICEASRLLDLTVSEKYRVSTSVVKFRPNRTS